MTTTTNERVLERRLGPLDAAALIVSNVIGGGILFTPPQIAAAVPAALPFLSTWAAGGLLAFAGAMAYAELAALRPRAGGEYVYLREAFGRLAAFLSGWTSFIAGFSGAIASSAVILASYLGRFFPAAGNSTPFLSIPIFPGIASESSADRIFSVTLSMSPQTVVALAAIYGMAWVHLRGVGPGRLVGNILATLKVSALLLFIAFGFSLGQGSAANLTQAGDVAIKGWLLALIPVMFTYSGWNAASYVAEEVRDPGRNVPRALAIGTGAVVILYLLLNALYIYVVPVDQLAAVKGSMLDLIADRLLGQTAGNIMAIVSIVSLLASISAMTFAGPRVYFAMGRDGVFFKQASSVHTRYKTPAVSILAQATWSSLLVLTAGADALVTYTGFAIVLFSGVAVVALFVLRMREPNTERPFRAWGYPVAPGIYVIASALILLNGLMNDPKTTGFGAIVILLGIPLFLLFRRRK